MKGNTLLFPVELWGKILQYSGYEVAVTFRQTCKSAKGFVDSQDNEFWRQMWMRCGFHDEFYPNGQRELEEWTNEPDGIFHHKVMTYDDDLTDMHILCKQSIPYRDSTHQGFGMNYELSRLAPWEEPTPQLWPVPRPCRQWHSWLEKLRWRSYQSRCAKKECGALFNPSIEPLCSCEFDDVVTENESCGRLRDQSTVLMSAGWKARPFCFQCTHGDNVLFCLSQRLASPPTI